MAEADVSVSAETSTRICSHMNDDHAATIHAMALSNLSNREAASCKVQNAKMTSVTCKDYTITYVLCSGDNCAMKSISVPFNPPLKSSSEIRPRLIEDHHRALTPKFTWLVTDPLMRMLVGASMLIGVGTALGQEELAKRVDDTYWASSIVCTIFGTSSRFAYLVVAAWYFTLVAHTLEAFYASYLCKKCLKMKTITTAKWFLLNVCTGFPIMKKIVELVEVDKAARSAKKSN